MSAPQPWLGDYGEPPGGESSGGWLSGGSTVIGRETAETLQGNTGADTLYGGAGNDYLLGGSDADALRGGAGNDRIEGGAGSLRLDLNASGTGITDATGNAVAIFKQNSHLLKNPLFACHIKVKHDVVAWQNLGDKAHYEHPNQKNCWIVRRFSGIGSA